MTTSRHYVSLRTYALAFAVVLSPAFFQITYSCDPGNTNLSSLEFELEGKDHIYGFNTDNRTYDVLTSSTGSSAIVRTQSMDPDAIVNYQWWAEGTIVESGFMGVGGGEVTTDVPFDQSTLRVNVHTPQGGLEHYVVNVTLAATSWGTAELIDASSTDGGDPEVVVDSTGYVTAVWAGGGTWSNGYTPGLGWGSAELLDLDAGGLPQVEVDPSGVVTAAWLQWQSSVWNISLNRYTPGVGWGVAEIFAIVDAGDPNWDSLQLAVNPDGDAVAVWEQDQARDDIWSNRYTPGSGWGTPELIAANADVTDDAPNPRVAINANGNAIVLWDAGRRDVGSFLRPAVGYSEYTPGVGWGVPELIMNSSDPQVGADASDDTFLAVWVGQVSSSFDARSNRYTPGVGWGTLEVISMLGWPVDSGPRVTVEPNGNAIAVWSQFAGSPTRTEQSVWSNRFTPGVGWGSAERFGIEDVAHELRVAMAPSGEAIVVWQGYGYPASVWSNRHTPGVGWGTTELIDNAPGPAHEPRVAVDPTGNATAVWAQLDGTGRYHIYASRSEAP